MHCSNGNYGNLTKPSNTGSCSDLVDKDKQAKKTSRLAIASIVFLGFAFVCFIIEMGFAAAFLFEFRPDFNLGVFSVLAIGFLFVSFVLGIIACIVIAMNKNMKGYGYTITPICLGSLFILSAGLMLVHAQYRTRREKVIRPAYNLRQLGKVISQYAEDHSGHLPTANKWCDLLLEYDPNLSKRNFKHPLREDWDCNFAFNKNLDGLRLDGIPDDTVLLFEADGNWNLNGGPELLATRRTEHGYIEVLFTNQTVQNYWFDKKAVVILKKDLSFMEKPLRWKP